MNEEMIQSTGGQSPIQQPVIKRSQDSTTTETTSTKNDADYSTQFETHQPTTLTADVAGNDRVAERGQLPADPNALSSDQFGAGLDGSFQRVAAVEDEFSEDLEGLDKQKNGGGGSEDKKADDKPTSSSSGTTNTSSSGKSVFAQIDDLYAQLDKGNLSSEEADKIRTKLQRLTQLSAMMTEISKMVHDSIMRTIAKIS